MFSFSDYLIDYLEFEDISHHEFAKQLDINPSQLSMILNKKRKLSYDVMKRIALVTPFSIEEIVKVESTYENDKKIKEAFEAENDTYKAYINRYKYKLLESYDDRIIYKDKDSAFQVVKDIMSYLRISAPYINKSNNVMFKSKHDKTELVNIWLEKCYRETRHQSLGEYTSDSIMNIVEKIKAFALNADFSIKELCKTFNENGIYLSIVEDLPGSKIRGAFKVLDNKPAVYITLKHKRPADIYFALLHELAHCKTDFNSAKLKSYISIDNTLVKEIPVAEKIADDKAYDWMISEEVFSEIVEGYKDCMFHMIAKQYQIPKMFLAYRLATSDEVSFDYSNQLYQQFNKVIKIN